MIFSILIVLSLIGCDTEDITPETPSTMPPSIMVDGEIYSTTGEERPIEPDEGQIKSVVSVVKETELPSNEGEINFPAPNAKYAKINDYEWYVVVSNNSEWVKFEKRDNWGLEIIATNVSPTGLTLLFNQSGGNQTGDLQTGSFYWLEVLMDDQWIPVEMLSSAHDVGWTSEAYIIHKNDKTEWEVNWEWLFGKLPIGNYRIGKEVMDFRATGIYAILNYYADFEVAE